MKNNLQGREYWIDAVRSFACLCVITTHAPIPNSLGGGEVFVSAFNYYSVAGASILFFMISGSLVLYKEKPIIPFIRKRITRIVFPMVFWTIITLSIDCILGNISLETLGRRICMIPFSPQVGTYWFIYVIFGIYLITPILASWLNRCTRRDVEFYLLIWGVTLLLPYLTWLNKDFSILINSSRGYLYYFYGFLGFAVLGFYLRRYVNIKKYHLLHYILFIILILLPVLLLNTSLIPHDIVHNRMSINIVLLAICYFIIIKHIKFSQRASLICYDFAQHSFGIYLVQILVMRRCLWPLLAPHNLHYAIQIPLVVILTAFFSYLLVHLISKFPCSKYIVGL